MACRLQNFDSDLLIGDVLLELSDVILGFGQIEVVRFILHFSHTPIMSSRDDADLFEQITILSRPHNEHRLDVPLKGGRVRKRSYDPLNLVLAGNRKARGKTTAAIGIPRLPSKTLATRSITSMTPTSVMPAQGRILCSPPNIV